MAGDVGANQSLGRRALGRHRIVSFVPDDLRFVVQVV